MRTGQLPQRQLRYLHAAALFALLAALLMFPGTARADAVQCGAVLKHNTTLDTDVVNCLGDGLVVGANGITIDLNGKTLDGTGRGIGIRTDGHDGVTIKNGTVNEFDEGIQLNGGTVGSVVDGLTVTNNELVGVKLDGANQNQVIHSKIQFQANRGLEILNGSTGNVVFDNTLFTNGDTGIFVQNSNGNLLQANHVTVSGDRGLVLEGASGNSLFVNTVSNNSDGGVSLLLGSNTNYLYGNTLTLNQDAGFIVNESNANRIEQNAVTDNGDAGLVVGRSIGAIVLNNTLSGSSDAGIFLEYSTDSFIHGNDVRFNTGGLEITSSHRNRVQLNNASNTTGIGIELQDGHANVIAHNIANANGTQGIHASAEAPEAAEQGSVANTVIECNTANENLGDGIVLGTKGQTVRMNTAHRNQGWGIHAADGTVDAGGNQATENAEGVQCFGVFCGPAPLDCPPPPPPPPPGSAPQQLVATAAAAATAAQRAPTARTTTAKKGSSRANGARKAKLRKAKARCRIPKVRGRKFVKARGALVRAGCRVGKVRWRHSKLRNGYVVAQSPRGGYRVRRGFKVNLIRSKGVRASRD